MSADIAAFIRDRLGHEPRDLSLFERLSEYELAGVFIKNDQTPGLIARVLLEQLNLSREIIEQTLGPPVEEQAARAA